MSVEFTNLQWQELGNALKGGHTSYTSDSFVRQFHDKTEYSHAYVELKERATSHGFRITPTAAQYKIEYDIPGTSRVWSTGGLSWPEVCEYFKRWSSNLERENRASDPWSEEAEDMAQDDSLFKLDELPKLDIAIDKSLDALKAQALQSGIPQERIEGELSEIKGILKKTARISTKREWMTLFKGIMIEKILDWGLQTELFDTICQVFIASVVDIQQLAEHATRMLN